MARAATDTFAGLRLADVPAFLLAQIGGCRCGNHGLPLVDSENTPVCNGGRSTPDARVNPDALESAARGGNDKLSVLDSSHCEHVVCKLLYLRAPASHDHHFQAVVGIEVYVSCKPAQCQENGAELRSVG